MSLADNVEYFRRLRELQDIGFGEFGGRSQGAPSGALVETERFGANPGLLKMFSFVPAPRQNLVPLVVVLHGCGQSAADYDTGAGWSTLAQQYGFAVLLPEQQRANNAQRCFNWFDGDDTTRERGEVASISQMIARMVADRVVDPKRIFVTGLSAGGAMTMAMLATYPEVFAGGAVIAGLPFGVARNMRDALMQMRMPVARPARELGDLVRGASGHRGRWPKLSVWHGTADYTVNAGNADEIVKQWLDLHGLPRQPMQETSVNGHPQQIWWNADGETVVEQLAITNMAHGTPLGIAVDNDTRYGRPGPFMLEAGISSSHHIAKFFGLTDRIRQPKAVKETAVKESSSAKLIPSVSPIASALPALTKKLWPKPSEAEPTELKPTKTAPPKAEPRRDHSLAPIDVAAVINRALQAAGLKK